MPYLFGDRVRLRAAEKEDITAFLRWINDEEVTENLFFSAPMSRVDEEQWFDAMMQKPANEHALVIEIKDESSDQGYHPIGTCQFHNLDWRNRSIEIGILIGEKTFWDQGYGTETMCLLLKHSFEVLNLHRVWLQVFAKNERGIRAYEKAGFKYEGRYRDAHYQHGKYHDVHLMSVLRNEWQKNQKDNPSSDQEG